MRMNGFSNRNVFSIHQVGDFKPVWDLYEQGRRKRARTWLKAMLKCRPSKARKIIEVALECKDWSLIDDLLAMVEEHVEDASGGPLRISETFRRDVQRRLYAVRELPGYLESPERRRALMEALQRRGCGEGAAFEDVESREVRGGMVALGVYKHTLRGKAGDDAVGDVPSILEKVIGGGELRSVYRENVLQRHHDAQDLLAPRIEGIVEYRDLRGVLYEYVDGTFMSIQRWPACKLSVYRRLSAIQPSEDLVQERSILWMREFGRIRSEGFWRYLESNLDETLVRVLEKIIRSIEGTTSRWPRMICHRDLHRGHVLMDKGGRLYCIDWDKWSVEPVGIGLPVQSLEEFSDGVDCVAKDLVERGTFGGSGSESVRLIVRVLIAAWNLEKAVRKAQMEGREAWTQRLRESLCVAPQCWCSR